MVTVAVGQYEILDRVGADASIFNVGHYLFGIYAYSSINNGGLNAISYGIYMAVTLMAEAKPH